MTLSPNDVEDKAFTQALRGYQMDEVDDFLDEVVTTLRGHEQQLREANDRIRSLEADLSSRGGDESAISRAFLAAQRSADALIAEAETQADKIKRDAEAEATKLIEDRDQQRRGLLEEINSMRAAVQALKTRLGDLASTVSRDVTAMESAVEEAERGMSAPPPLAAAPAPRSEETEAEVEEPPTLDLTGDATTRVSARPWERG